MKENLLIPTEPTVPGVPTNLMATPMALDWGKPDPTYRYQCTIDGGKTWHDVPSNGTTLTIECKRVSIFSRCIAWLLRY